MFFFFFIGKLPIVLGDKVEANLATSTIEVKGPLGVLNFEFSSKVNVVKENNTIVVSPVDSSDRESLALWGTTRALIANMVEWVSTGFKKSLEINWVWYKFEVAWDKLVLSIGFSHKVEMPVPNGIKIAMDEKLKTTL